MPCSSVKPPARRLAVPLKPPNWLVMSAMLLPICRSHAIASCALFCMIESCEESGELVDVTPPGCEAEKASAVPPKFWNTDPGFEMPARNELIIPCASAPPADELGDVGEELPL